MTLEEAQQKIKELEAGVSNLEDELDGAKSEISDLEDEIDNLKEEVKMWLEIFADYSNWTGDKWTPVLKYLGHPAEMANEVLNANK